MRVTLVALLCCTFALAGCASKAAETVEDDLEATVTTGIVRGIVVDTAVRPLANVHVTLRVDATHNLHANTTATGGFGFEGLLPGTYFIKASKPGYAEVQVSAEVVAGESNPPLTRISMEVNPSTRPFVEAYVFKGFMDCSITSVVVGAALCALPNGLTCGLDPVPCIENVTNDNTQVHYLPQRPPTWAQSEMVWESTQALGENLELMYSWDCGNDNGGFLCDHEVRGPSPLLLTANRTVIDTIGIGSSTDVYIRVFNTYHDATSTGVCAPPLPPPAGTRCPRGVGATLQQDFTVYTHLFYGFAPPVGYQFSVDGEPKLPDGA